MAKSTLGPLWLCIPLKGGYTVQPVPTPFSIPLANKNNSKAGGNNQKLILLSRGNLYVYTLYSILWSTTRVIFIKPMYSTSYCCIINWYRWIIRIIVSLFRVLTFYVSSYSTTKDLFRISNDRIRSTICYVFHRITIPASICKIIPSRVVSVIRSLLAE